MSTNRRGPGERAGLTTDQVLQAARVLAQREGAESLTMRRLATEMGVAPNALYSYFSSKDDLLDAFLDSLLADIKTDQFEAEGPRDRVIELMVDSRRLLLEHADFLPQLLSRPMRGPNASLLGETTLQLLSQLGVTDQNAVNGLRVLLTYLFGSAAIDAPRTREQDPQQRQSDSEAAFAARTGLPQIAAQSRALAQPPETALFETGLEWLLNGIERTAHSAP